MIDPAHHEITHHHYTLFAVCAEYLMAFSLHFLPTLHLTKIAIAIGMATFAVYTLVSAAYFRRSLVFVCSRKER
jgi:hypothetical protein